MTNQNGNTGMLIVLSLTLGFGIPTITLASNMHQKSSGRTLGLPRTPSHNIHPATISCIDLGRRLFSDQKLSADGEISCATCHVATKAFSDGLSVAEGEGGQRGTRNAPSLLNVAFQTNLFWDGRTASLEAQALKPIFNPLEQGVTNKKALLAELNKDTSYRAAFLHAFPDSRVKISAYHIAEAIACYERTLMVADSQFDRYEFDGNKSALSISAIRGLSLFRGRAGCAQCHQIDVHDASFADGKFHRRGIGLRLMQANLGVIAARATTASESELDRLLAGNVEAAALGRFVVTHDPNDIGSFKTPSLRNVALTAPYMHDGSVATLRDAVVSEAYYGAAEDAAPVQLSASQIADIVEFLNSLTSAMAMKQ